MSSNCFSTQSKNYATIKGQCLDVFIDFLKNHPIQIWYEIPPPMWYEIEYWLNLIDILSVLATYEASSHNSEEPPSLAGDKWVSDDNAWWAPEHSQPRV